METAQNPTSNSPSTLNPQWLLAAFAVLIATFLGLCLRGYQLGTSNQAVYLIDAIRRSNPRLLTNDWWVNHTLQYHLAYSFVASKLKSAGLLAPAFLVMYLVLLLLFNVAWYRIARLLGCSVRAYLLSVLLFYFSAGGTCLGMYSFFQDSSFLPSNLANVAMLWGILYWMERRRLAAGIALGLAGFFHLNHAVVGIGLWGALGGWDWLTARRSGQTSSKSLGPHYWSGGLILLGMALVNIVPAARASLAHHAGMPLGQFIDLYVRLRHPHHYDPSTWPIALWICFFYTFPFAWMAWRRAARSEARVQASRIFALLMALNVIALIGAGLFYFSEILVQLSFYRFSIYPKLLTCIGMAWLMADDLPLTRRLPWLGIAAVAYCLVWGACSATGFMADFLHHNRGPLLIVALLCGLSAGLEAIERTGRSVKPLAMVGCVITLVVGAISWHSAMGLLVLSGITDSDDYIACCEWVKDPAHTPVDAIFLVPPQEQEMRLTGERAIVVDFKCVPHLPAELLEWQQQLCDVLDLKDLSGLPHRFDKTLIAIRDRYESLPAQHLIAVSRKYNVGFIVVEHGLTAVGLKEVFVHGNCHVYAVGG